MRQRWIEATALEAQAAQALQREPRWTVHSSFAGAVNLVAPGGAWVSVLARPLEGPQRLHVSPSEAPLTLWAPPGSCGLRSRPGRLRVDGPRGQLWLTWASARAYTVAPLRPGARDRVRSPPMGTDPAHVLRRGLAVLARRLASVRPRQALSRAERSAWRSASALQRALRAQDAAGVGRRVRALVGLGDGLTPSGDDILTGVLASLCALPRRGCAPTEWARVTLEDALLQAMNGTTPVARQQLEQALSGYFCRSVADALQGLGVGESAGRAGGAADSSLQSAADVLLGVGARSGRALLLGVVMGGALVARAGGGRPAETDRGTAGDHGPRAVEVGVR